MEPKRQQPQIHNNMGHRQTNSTQQVVLTIYKYICVYIEIPLKTKEISMDLDTNKDYPYNEDDKLIMEVELGDSDKNSNLQTTIAINNYTDTQLTKLLDTEDNLDELQIDALSFIRTGSTNITHSTTNNNDNDANSNNKNANKNYENDSDTATTKSTNDETNDKGNLTTDTDSDTG